MDERVLQPARVIVGNCPACGRTLVILNDHETWPYVRCGCGWGGATTEVANHHRVEGVRPTLTYTIDGVKHPLPPANVLMEQLREAVKDLQALREQQRWGWKGRR